METLLINGMITATSNKKSDLGTKEAQRKSVYITLDKESEKKAIDFGLNMYTSKEGDNFFIVKASNEISLYKGNEVKKMRSDIDSDNFSTLSNVGIAIMKGEKNRNVFYRLYALSVDNLDQIEKTKHVNPFTNQEVKSVQSNDDDDFKTDVNDERVLF